MNGNEVLSAESAMGQDTGTKLHGRCLSCHRRLKDPESMKRGLGPVCQRKYGAVFSKVSGTVHDDGED